MRCGTDRKWSRRVADHDRPPTSQQRRSRLGLVDLAGLIEHDEIEQSGHRREHVLDVAQRADPQRRPGRELPGCQRAEELSSTAAASSESGDQPPDRRARGGVETVGRQGQGLEPPTERRPEVRPGPSELAGGQGEVVAERSQLGSGTSGPGRIESCTDRRELRGDGRVGGDRRAADRSELASLLPCSTSGEEPRSWRVAALGGHGEERRDAVQVARRVEHPGDRCGQRRNRDLPVVRAGGERLELQSMQDLLLE